MTHLKKEKEKCRKNGKDQRVINFKSVEVFQHFHEKVQDFEAYENIDV